MILKKKQFCRYCPKDKCLLDYKICNPKKSKTVIVITRILIHLSFFIYSDLTNLKLTHKYEIKCLNYVYKFKIQ